jgi:hypothetical protein
MMKVSINKLIENPEKVIKNDRCNMFYDWFCSDKSLERRALAFIPKLKFLVKEGIIDGDKCYVWFKNNCPVVGTLYDDMRISNIKTDIFLGGFCPRTGHTSKENKCNVWTLEPYFEDYEYRTWSDFKKEIKTNPEFKARLVKAFKK